MLRDQACRAVFPWRGSGTSFVAMDRAKPSTMAVLPTPLADEDSVVLGSSAKNLHDTFSFTRPSNNGGQLFLLSRAGLGFCQIGLEPLRNSNLRLFLQFPLMLSRPYDRLHHLVHLEPEYPESSWMTCCLTRDRSAPSLVRTCAATPSPSRIRPNKMCSVPM